ncbi:InlB B-repeat-containing protein [Candidatus Saccharibacteria bacterium]|nr:InlB B-repeat-containing protein [Candidatus Saccharibacteria bacterium]
MKNKRQVDCISQVQHKGILYALLCTFITIVFCAHNTPSAGAIAKQSTLTISDSAPLLSINILPSSSGTFGKTANNTISVTTDNFTGYSLIIAAENSTSLVNGNDDEITSISTAIDETTFTNNSIYNNQWGYKPSQYVTTSNNINTTIQNSNFLPIAPTTGSLLAVTTAANNVADTYTIAFGARIDMSLPADTYTHTYVLMAVANSIVYNITYDDNTNETVTSMPSPNPQALNIDGGTPAADSHAALSNAVPVMNATAVRSFGGWCTVATTYNSNTGNDECSGTIYQPGDDYPIDQTVDGTNITLYAIWLTDPFPIVWSQMGKCIFDGAEDTNNGYLSGSECSDYSSYKFIDTGVALYSASNYNKDYEVHFTVDRYIPTEQPESQSTIFNDKLSSSVTASPWGGKSPGLVIRRNGSGIEIKSTYGAPTTTDGARIVSKSGTNAFAGTDIRIFRINGVIYSSIDNGPLIELQDYTSFNQQFGLSAWFGAYPDNVNCSEGCTAGKRILEGELSNMYIRLGDFDESNLHEITLDVNGGTLAGGSSMLIVDGDAIGNNLETPARTNWLFDGWYDESNQLVNAATVPDSDETYTAHWTKTVTLAQITNSTININTGDTESIIVTNSAELEPYTFSSNNSSIASVDPSTGLVTGVAAGTAIITMTGTRSSTTQTIEVTVTGSSYTVSFDAAGGYSVSDLSVGGGATLTEIPYTERSGYVLEGWYTGPNGTGTKLDTSTQITASIEYHAHWLPGDFVCRTAEELHVEQCLQTTDSSGGGCRSTGFSASQNITYGYLVNSLTLKPGAAYDCDVDYDGIYDAETERFYYFGMENGNAKLVHYANLTNISQSYNNALTYLPNAVLDPQSPSTPVWDNPHLVTYSDGDYAGKAARFMTYPEITNGLWGGTNAGLTPTDGSSLYLFEKSAFANTTITDGIWLEKQTNYNNRIQTRSRGLTHGNTSANAPRATIVFPEAYLEKYFVPPANYVITFDRQNGTATFTETITPGSELNTAYPQTDPTYTDHIFQGWYTASSGGTQISSTTVPSGDTTYYAQWKGTVALAQVSNNTLTVVEGGNTTASVANATDLETFTFSSSNTSIATVDSSTGVVTGVAEGTAYISITGTDSHATNSNIITVNVVDPSSVYRITFDPQNGENTSYADVLVGNTIGGQMPVNNPTWANHVFQRWYDSATGNTVTSATEPTGNMTVYAEWKLDVTQAVIADNDLTVPAGESVTIGISNSSALESYTFSSNDTSIATVDASTGVVTGVNAGTVNIIMTGSQSNLTKTIEVEVTPAVVVQYRVTFNTNGGTLDNNASSTRDVDSGSAVGSLPTASKTNYRFFGWYTDDGTFYEEVDPSTVVNNNVTYYARWVEDISSFPIVFAEINACQFNGTSAITGDYCLKDEVNNTSIDKTKTYIDTGVSLYTAANYNSDYEIGFTIVDFDFDSIRQMTMMQDKYENGTNWPGLAVRRYDETNYIEFTHSMNGTKASDHSILASSVKRVVVVRQSGVIKYSINGGNLITLQDTNSLTAQNFDHTVWFGASAKSNKTPQRQSIAKITDMYVKLGAPTEYTVDLEVDGGELPANAQSNYTITIGDPVGALPTPTAPSANYTFAGWYDGNTLVSDGTQYIPTGNVVLTAHWTYSSSDTPVPFDVSNNATRGYKTIINQWVQSPVNITTFNTASPINNSTWGNTSELSEAQFWTTLKNNFETNDCKVPSYGDAATTTPNPTAWANGSVDCSKPDVYDTLIGAPLNVYLYNNQTLGAQVSYAEASDGIIRNLIPGNTYKWVKDGDNTVYGYVTVTSNNSDYGTRWVDAGTIRNVRDLGGLPADTDGDGTVDAYVKYGKLFRGEKLGTESATKLTNLGITKEYNVGDEYASDTHLSNYEYSQVIHYNFNYNSGDENNPNSNYMKAWNVVTDIMEDVTNANNPQNIYFHCRVGADRTGTVAYLLEGLLGVPDEERYQEYSLTHLSGLFDRTRYYKEKSSSNNLKFVYMLGYLKTNADILAWYMQNPNASSSLIASFKSAMTTQISSPSPAPANNPQQSLSTPSSSDSKKSTISKDTSVNDGYAAPLGVYETSIEDDFSVSETQSLSAAELAVVTATAVASGAAVSYVIAKNKKDEEGS